MRGQPDRAEVDQRHAESPVEDAEGGVARGDAQVAPERELEAARDRVALDRRDHRLVELHARRPHRPVARLRASRLARPRQLLQVEAGAEVAARAGQDGHRQRFVGVEALEAVDQRRRGRGVDGVAHAAAGRW